LKEFFPTYLYVKTHKSTGLKYFGKTIGDPNTYRGSGKYWLAHLQKHGNSVETEIIGYFTDKDQCTEAAVKFSIENNIVGAVDENNKKIWANQIIENGIDGGDTKRTNYRPHTAESKKKLSEANKGKTPWNKGLKGVCPGNTRPRSESTKQKLREANLGKKQSAETIEKKAKSNTGKKRSGTALKNIQKGIEERWKKISELSDEEQFSLSQERSRRAIQAKIDHPVSDQQKEKIRQARSQQENVFDLGEYLKNRVIVVDKMGNRTTVSKETYYSQQGPKNDWEWVSHKSKEAKLRKNKDTNLQRTGCSGSGPNA